MLVYNMVKHIKDSKFKKAIDSIKIEIEIDEAQVKAEAGNEAVLKQEYKGYQIVADVETGEFDIYSVGGAKVSHTATLELAQAFIDNIEVK